MELSFHQSDFQMEKSELQRFSFTILKCDENGKFLVEIWEECESPSVKQRTGGDKCKLLKIRKKKKWENMIKN